MSCLCFSMCGYETIVVEDESTHMEDGHNGM